MPRNISAFAIGQSFALTSGEVFLVIATIRHAPTATTFRVVNDTQNITSRGQVYTAFPFSLTLPMESGEEIGSVQFQIDNTDLALVDMLRAATEPPRFDIEVIIASAPDQVEIALLDLALRSVTWDAQTVTGTLQNDDILSQGYPGDAYTPLEWQGLF